MVRKAVRQLVGLFGIFLIGLTLWVFSQTPSHDREWELGQEQLPHIVFEEDQFTVYNLRDFAWTGPFEAEQRYIEDTYKLSELETVDVVISHFDDFEGLAHIFLSFGFLDGRHVSISLETRREANEEFSPWLGLLRQYEIIYVVGTDRDVVGLRTGHRNERVYIYPTIATPEKAQELFVRIVNNINAIYEEPTFYNTLVHNCTNELTREVEAMSDIDFPFTYKSILPGYFDEVLYEQQLINGSKEFAEVKRAAFVNNELVDESHPNYAVHVREQRGVGTLDVENEI